MTLPRRRGNEGFTLVELLISMVLSVIIIGVVVTAFIVTLKSTEQTRTELGESHDTQLVAAYLPADLLSAGGATSDVDSTAATATGCASSPIGNLNVVRLRWSDTFGASPTYFSSSYRVVNAAGEWRLMRYSCQASTVAGLLTATASSLVVAHNLKAVVTSADLPSVALSGDQVTMTITDATGYSYVIVGARRTPLVGATASATPSPPPSPAPLQATVQSITLNNSDAIGNVKLVATFSLALESACATKFTVTDTSTAARNFSGTATLDATNKIATVTLPTSTLANANTTVTGLRIDFAGDTASCTGASFTNGTVTDRAAPVITGITTTVPGSVTGLAQNADALSVSFSESLASPPSVTTVTESGGSNSNPDSLVLPGVFASAAPFSANDYISNGNKDANIPASSSFAGSTLVITLGTYLCSTGSCGALAAGSSGTVTYTQISTLADAAGNSLTSTATTATARTISGFRAF